MKIGMRFGHSRVRYQYGHGDWHYRLIGSNVYKFCRFTHWIDGRVEITRETVS
ncbi:hypothetical protein ACIQUL_36070 [Streptomyces sp. NPDC090303]|uniref:hypothetical protein n=1 Tax=Streptomyces sp. NPDC090303 TaxID=3365960 RepID=UPI003817F606